MISLFVLGLFLLTAAWNMYYAARWNRNLTVSLNFAENHVYAGEQAQVTEQIENRKKLMLSILEVSFHMDKGLSFHDCENTVVSDFVYKRDIFALLGYQRITRKLTLSCMKRGCYRIDESYLTTFSMLRTRRFSVAHPADAELYVYAARVDVSDILVICERLMGSIQCAKRLYEDPFAFSSIREYTVTDPMNTINWKASARTGELMVNTFESTLTEKVMICLDMEDSGILKYDYLIEDSVSVAASLAQKFIARGMEVGLCVNVNTDTHAFAAQTDTDAGISGVGERVENPPVTRIVPASGKKQLDNIERTLAKCRSDGKVMAFGELMRQPVYDLTKGLIFIFISKNAVQNQSVIREFVGKEQQAVWIVPCIKNDAFSIKIPDNIRMIRREVERS